MTSILELPAVQSLLKRRLGLPPDDAPLVAPRGGVDVEAAPAPLMAWAQPPPMETGEGGAGRALGQALGGLAFKRAPKTPDKGGTVGTVLGKAPKVENPIAPLPQLDFMRNAGKSLPRFGQGGTLKKGDIALVGDQTKDNPSGQEVVINDGKQTHVVPIEQVLPVPARPQPSALGASVGEPIQHPQEIPTRGAAIPAPTSPSAPLAPPLEVTSPPLSLVDPRKDRRERIGVLRDDRTVTNSKSRWKDAGKLALTGALEGFATTGSLGGAIGGAVGGFGRGALDRKAYPRVQRGRELQRLEADEARDVERQKLDLDLLGKQVGIGKTIAETDDVRGRGVREDRKAQRDYLERRAANLITMHGRAGRYNPDDPKDAASQAIKREADKLRDEGVDVQLVPYEGPQAKPERFKINGHFYTMKPGGLPEPLMVDGKHAQDPNDVADEKGFTPKDYAAMWERGEQRGYQRSRDAQQDEKQDTRENRRRADDSANLEGTFEAAKQRLGTAKSRTERARAEADMRDAWNKLRTVHSDRYEAGEQNGHLWVKKRASTPAHPNAGRKFSRSQFPQLRKDYGINSDEEVEAKIKNSGGIIVD